MPCRRIRLASGLCLSLYSVSSAGAQQTRYISGTVYQANSSQPVAGAEVHIDGAGSDIATNSGEFRFPLRSPLRVGFPATFHVLNWEVVNPCNLVRGRTYLPDPDAESVPLTVLHRGDRRLGTGDSAACVVIERASRFEVSMDGASRFQAWFRAAPPPAYARQLGQSIGCESLAVVLPAAYPALFSTPFQRVQASTSRKADAFFEQQAKGLGLTTAQLAAAINEWAKSTDQVYDKGLAALYQGRYAEAASFLSKSIPSPPGKLLFRYVPLSRADYELGNFKAAESALRQVAAVYREDPIVLNDLAVVLAREAKYTEAKPMFERSLEIAQATLGPQSPDVANTLNNLAEVYRYQGDFAEAEKRYQQALVTFGPASPLLARLLNNMAALYDDQGKPEKAENLYLGALKMDQDELPADHPDIARDLNNLGLFYRTYGGKAKYGEAEKLLTQALDIRKKVLGKSHPDVARTLSNLAGLYAYQNRLAEAEPLAKLAVTIDEATLSAEHPDLATDLHNLASIYQAEHRVADAEPLFKRALQIDSRAFGPLHPNVASASLGLASVYMEEHKYADAQQLLEPAFCTFRRVLGVNHPKTGAAAMALAMNLYRLGRCANPRACMDQVANFCPQ